MRKFNTAILLVLTTLSAFYLFLYGRELVGLSIWNDYHLNISSFDEVSVWFYKKRNAAGQLVGPHRLYPRLSIFDPDNGPNDEIRIPGWIPALGALTILGCAASGKFTRV